MKNVVYSLIFTGILASAGNIFATNSSMLEIFGDESADVPDVAPLQAGKLSDKTRKFDLICTGRCNAGNNSVPLKIEDHEIPDLFTIDADGSVVIAPAKPMATITMPKGHKSFVKITLQNIAGQSSDVPNWVYLGIRQKGEITNTLSKEAVLDIAMFSEDVVELVPLVSGTSSSYTKVEPGTKISAISGFPQTSGDIKFGAVYKVSVEATKWLKGLKSDRQGNDWRNYGSLGVGKISGQDGDQLLAIKSTSQLAYSSDGIHWTDMNDSVVDSSRTKEWFAGPKYENGVWCVCGAGVKGLSYSVDGAVTWKGKGIVGSDCIAFCNEIFMVVDCGNGKVFTSQYADTLVEIGNINVMGCRILIYGNGKWIGGNNDGDLYQSEDGKGTWALIENSDLKSKTSEKNFYGGCFVNGYFYVISGKPNSKNNAVFRSPDGVKWTTVVDGLASTSGYFSITYFKGMLYAYDCDGYYSIGFP